VPGGGTLAASGHRRAAFLGIFVCGHSLHDLGFEVEEVAEELAVAISATLGPLDKPQTDTLTSRLGKAKLLRIGRFVRPMNACCGHRSHEGGEL
jgi:hypothetical protein